MSPKIILASQAPIVSKCTNQNTQVLYSFTQLDRIRLVCKHPNEKAQDNPEGENVTFSITFVVLQT